jgi:hypothetical protein
MVASACQEEAVPPLLSPPLVFDEVLALDPIVRSNDARSFGSRTFSNLVVDPVHERVVVSWLARDLEDEDDKSVMVRELRFATAPYRSCPR